MEQLHGTPEQLAQRAADHRLRFVAIAGPWQDPDRLRIINPRGRIARYAAPLVERGIDVWVWGYPQAGREAQFCDFMATAVEAAHGAGWILDPELPYKGQPEAMRVLLSSTLDRLTEAQGLGFTSYGLTTAHRTFPWDVAKGYGWGSPQTYKVPAPTAKTAIAQWRDLGWRHIVGSVPSFGPQSGEKLDDYLTELRPLVEGFCFWSWRSTSRTEWKTIAKWAESDW